MKQIFTVNETIGAITSPQELFKKIKRVNIDYEQENFIVFFLDSKNKIKKSEILFKGGVNACLIDPITLFRKAILYNTPHVIVSHNHPSGNICPSDEDRELFNKLKEIGEILGIKVYDSIIINKKEFYSMNDGQ